MKKASVDGSGRKRVRESISNSGGASPVVAKKELLKSNTTSSSKTTNSADISDAIPNHGALVVIGTYASVVAGLVLSGSKKHAARTASGGPAPRRLALKFSSKHHTGSINAVAMSDKYMATAANGDEKIFLYTVKDHYSSVAELGSLSPASEVRCMCFPFMNSSTGASSSSSGISPAASGSGKPGEAQSKFLMCGCADGTIGVYNTRTWECEAVVPVHGGFGLEKTVKQNIAATANKKKKDEKTLQAENEQKQLDLLNNADGCGIAAMAVFVAPTGNVLAITAGSSDRRVAVVDMSTTAVLSKFKLPAVHADAKGRQKHFERATWNALSVSISPRDAAQPTLQTFAVLTGYDVWVYSLVNLKLIGRFSTRSAPKNPEGGDAAAVFAIPNPRQEMISMTFVSPFIGVVTCEDGSLWSFDTRVLEPKTALIEKEIAAEEEAAAAAAEAEEDEEEESDFDEEEEDEEEEEDSDEDEDEKAHRLDQKEAARLQREKERRRKNAIIAAARKRPVADTVAVSYMRETDNAALSFGTSPVKCVVDTSAETVPSKAQRIQSLFTAQGHAKRVKSIQLLPAASNGKPSLLVTADTAGVVATWCVSVQKDNSVRLDQVAMAHCEGRITTMNVTTR